MTNLKKFFRRGRFKSQLLDGKYRVVEAFTLDGTSYFMYDSAVEVPTGRMLAAQAIYTEMGMCCDREYLEAHCKAVDKILNAPKISLTYIMQLNINLKERLGLLPLPDFVYKLASVIFFDSSENPYSYDFDYNKIKIDRWKKDPGTLDFFLSRLSTELIPSLRPVVGNSKMFFNTSEQIDAIHRAALTKILSAS